MKKFYSNILLIFLLICIFEAGITKNSNSSNNVYAGISSSVHKLETEIGNSNGNIIKDDLEIALIRKNTPKAPVVPKKDAAKTQLELIKKSGIINIVFFGLDRRNSNESSRSDSIMVVSIDEKKQKIKVTSRRIRYVGYADYERTERQRRVLNEILRKVKDGGIIKLPKTISTLLSYVKTSLSAGEVLKLALKGVGFKTDNIEQYRLPVDGTYKSQYIRGMAVLVPNIEENKKKLYEFIYGIK